MKLNWSGQIVDLKLADFGQCCEVGQKTSKVQMIDFGTRGYIAPEGMVGFKNGIESALRALL